MGDVARSKDMTFARITTDLYIGHVPLCLPEKRVAFLPFLTQWYLLPKASSRSLSPVLLPWMSQEEESVVIILWLILAMP